MSFENAYLKQAASSMFSSAMQARIAHEQCKGCSDIIYPEPVRPEPAFEPDFDPASKYDISKKPLYVPDRADVDYSDIVRLKIWVSPVQKCDWNRSELMVKQFCFLRHRAAMEIAGNSGRITMQLMCRREDASTIHTAFQGQFELCRLSCPDQGALTGYPGRIWEKMAFWDLCPPPPYSDLFTVSDELQRSPYTTLINALASLDPEITGFYQFVFEPVNIGHNWHLNVKQMLDILYKVKSYDSVPDVPRYAEQNPSASLVFVSNKLETKCHNDKPFFAGSLRFGVLDPENRGDKYIRNISEMAGLFLHGGNRMRVLSDNDYRRVVPQENFRRMFLLGLLHRPGFLLNSSELAGFVHIPGSDISQHIAQVLKPLETLPADESLGRGIPLGCCDYADTPIPVCIPEKERFKHTHIIGTTGTGKTHLLLQMIIHDINSGHGTAVIDPHGQLVSELLDYIPPDCADKVIYFSPGRADFVPIWNPLNCGRIARDRIALDITDSFKSFVSGWGHRLEHILRQAILGVLHLPGGSFMDVCNVLRRKSPESRQILSQILETADNPMVKNFWKHDFPSYSSSDIQPVHHKLSALMTELAVQLMLSQKYSSFDLTDVMKTGRILLGDLSNVGTEVKKVLGCLMLSLLNSTAMKRDYKRSADSLLPFHIYCDEAHMFVTDAMEDIIAQVRKARVSITLAHQFLNQFDSTKVGALTSMGSRIVFAVNDGDASQLKKAMLGKVKADELVDLELGQAVARINNRVVRLRTDYPVRAAKTGLSQEIIEYSFRHYCMPIEKAKREVFAMGGYKNPAGDIDLSGIELEDYDEF
jgi:hypothetical protein